ncbi:hypothetical protein BUW91_28100 (plasmid) [Priestia megaterium]|nr:hypothetical protein BUW91_28100 [Priestia megaterium]
MHKKSAFYTYALTVKYSLYGNNMILFIYTCILIVKSHLSCKYWVAFYFAYLLTGWLFILLTF